MSNIIRMDGDAPTIYRKTESLPSWQSHFDKYCIAAGSFEIPRPFMAAIKIESGYAVNCEKTRTPVLAGGLSPYGEKYFECGKVWVYLLEKKGRVGGYKPGHYWIDQSVLFAPDMEEYKKHFKKDVENMTFFIENKIHKGLKEEISRVSIRDQKK